MPVEEPTQKVNTPETRPGDQTPKRKKVITAILVLVVVVVVLAALFIAVKTFNTDQTAPTPPAPSPQEAEIKGEKDLKQLEDELNSLDFADLEKDLTESNADASKF